MKKLLNILFVVLTICGVVFSVVNFSTTSLHAVRITNADAHYHAGLNNCYEPAYACHKVVVTPKR